ncbi:MAG: Arc family DNA-binding protein [Oscillospiraceae bacterium]|nr:Arc family DNA-binding protein [Oscillospiraceae bacterium]
MKDNLPRFTLRIPQNLLDKLGFIAEYEGRTKNKEIEQLIKRRVEEFEEIHGKIETNGSEADE